MNAKILAYKQVNNKKLSDGKTAMRQLEGKEGMLITQLTNVVQKSADNIKNVNDHNVAYFNVSWNYGTSKKRLIMNAKLKIDIVAHMPGRNLIQTLMGKPIPKMVKYVYVTPSYYFIGSPVIGQEMTFPIWIDPTTDKVVHSSVSNIIENVIDYMNDSFEEFSLHLILDGVDTNT